MGELPVATATAKTPKIEGRAAQARFFCRPQWQKKKGWFFNKHKRWRTRETTRTNTNVAWCQYAKHIRCALHTKGSIPLHILPWVCFFSCLSATAAVQPSMRLWCA